MTLLAALLSFAFSQLVPSPEYEQARAELDAALEAVNSDPEAGLERLTLALQDLARYPEQLIDDPATREQRTTATLALARGHANAGQERLAIEAMDQALREAEDTDPHVERFGARTLELAEKREKALHDAGYGGIEVDCGVECRVYVDGHEVSNPSPPLWLGRRRVVVRAVEGELEPASWAVALTEPDHTVTLVYPVIEPEAIVEPEAVRRRQKDRGPAPLLASGGTMLAGGIALTAFGISRWARGTEVEEAPDGQIRLADYRPAGKTLVGIGIASIALGITLMSLEIVRARKARERNHVAIDVTPRYLGLSLSGQF